MKQIVAYALWVNRKPIKVQDTSFNNLLVNELP